MQSCVLFSVVDLDPYVFGPPGSGIVIILYGSGSGLGSGSFHQLAKKVRKTLISTIFWVLFDILSMKTDINVPSKINKQKIFEKNLYFVGFLPAYSIWLFIQSEITKTVWVISSVRVVSLVWHCDKLSCVSKKWRTRVSPILSSPDGRAWYQCFCSPIPVHLFNLSAESRRPPPPPAGFDFPSVCSICIMEFMQNWALVFRA